MRTLARAAWAENAGLRLALGFHVFLAVFALVAMPFDHRLILGINPWIKPLKFDVSVLLYLATVALLLAGLAPRFARIRSWLGWGIAVCMVVEDAVISGQSLRGVRSHMNFATTGDALAFSVMGLFIALNTALLAWLLVLYLQRTQWPAAVATRVRLGLVTIIAGGFEGVLMVSRKAHTVGAEDGLAGLPLVNWSVGHGDLRVAHFFAIHALQVMPLLGWAVSRMALPARVQVGMTILLCASYAGLIYALFHQAMLGRPVLGIAGF